MRFLVLGLLLASMPCAKAQVEAADVLAEIKGIQQAIEDGEGVLQSLVKGLMGANNTNRLFYFPTKDEPATPAKWNFKYEDVKFESTDGTSLHGWFIPAKGAAIAKGTVVFSHGNAGSIGHHLGFVMWLSEAGYNVFMYDYRGFGKSEGQVDRLGMVNDVKAAFRYIKKRPEVDAKKLISYGHSLGGAKSIAALAQEPMQDLKAVIIDGTFSSYRLMAEVIAGKFGADLISDELSPKDLIGKVQKAPLLVIHGEQDEVVPFAQGEELFKLANEPKTFFQVAKGSHGNSLSRDSGAYRKRMLQWLEQIM